MAKAKRRHPKTRPNDAPTSQLSPKPRPNDAPPLQLSPKPRPNAAPDEKIQVLLFAVDCPINAPVVDAADTGELPHVDSAADGFTDEAFSLTDCHRFEGGTITFTQ